MTPTTTGTTIFGSPSIQPEAKFEVNEIVAPTERSMPPVSTTIVWPRLTNPSAADCWKTLRKLFRLAKRGLAIVPITSRSTMSPTTTSRDTGI